MGKVNSAQEIRIDVYADESIGEKWVDFKLGDNYELDWEYFSFYHRNEDDNGRITLVINIKGWSSYTPATYWNPSEFDCEECFIYEDDTDIVRDIINDFKTDFNLTDDDIDIDSIKIGDITAIDSPYDYYD